MADRRCFCASVLVVIAVAMNACATNRDDLEVARDRLGRGDLLTTIVHLDRVPPTHDNYLEARSLARAVERRMRTGQRLFARGLSMRAEWRDDEAIESFELARQVWPCIDGVDRMIDATRQRMRALAPNPDPDPGQLPAAAVATTQPVADDIESGGEQLIGPMPLAMVEAPIRSVEVVSGPPVRAAGEGDDGAIAGPSAPEAGVSLSGVSGRGPTASRPVIDPERILQLKLERAAASLADGRLDEALDSLEALRIRHPRVPEVVALLTRVLHQRALLLYGQGQLQAAMDAWGRILEIDPQHAQALEFHRAAETELRALRAAPPR